MAFNPNGENIVYRNEKGIIKILNLQGKVLQVFDADSNYIDTLIKFSPDGKTTVSASDEGKIKIWNINSNKSINIAAHTSSVNSISFSPDSKIIASASKDGTVKLWNLEGRELKTLKANSSQKYLMDKNDTGIGIGVTSVTFSPNGITLAYGDSDTGKITLLNFDIDDLLKKSCDNLRDYLKNNPSVSTKDKHLCDDILM